MPTHEVFNQSPAFSDINLYRTDWALVDSVLKYGKDDGLAEFGQIVGSEYSQKLGRLANEHAPVLYEFDNKGHRIDEVEFHPAYHELMSISAGQGLHNSIWLDGGQTNVTRSAGIYLTTQMEAAHVCPITMTNACVPALQKGGEIGARWLEKILVRDYDPAIAPIEQKRAVTIGMGMTEKQGGTDVRANTTIAKPVSGPEFRVTGHKWFMSAPMCDAFLVLAQAPGGLSCFLVPRFLPDGNRNTIAIQRLKNKLGNRANASSEVEFDNTTGFLIGEEGAGIRTIIEMVTYTRLDCVASSAGLMRNAIAQTRHHVEYRTVFQKKLIDQPLMRQVIADMVLDHEAAVALAMRLANSFDQAEQSHLQSLYFRFMTPVIKYMVCKNVPAIAYEAMECLGGNGYVENGPMARLYREAPLNAIWEGSGNVMCLDFLRAMQKDAEGLIELIESFEGGNTVSQQKDWLKDRLAKPAGLEAEGRIIVEKLGRLAASSLLVNNAPAFISDAYIANRVNAGFRQNYGTLQAGTDISAILNRSGSSSYEI